MADRRVEYMRLDEIDVASRNPKQHDEGGIRKSINHHGLGELPLLDERTGRLVAGHGRRDQLVAAEEAGENPPDGVRVDEAGAWLIPVVRGWSSKSDADAEAYLVGSNRLTVNGGVDDFLMTQILSDLAGDNLLDVTGYDSGDLDALEALYGDPGPAGGGSLGSGLGDRDLDGLDDEDDDGDDLDAELDALDQSLGKGKTSDLWQAIRVVVPPVLLESWKAHLDLYGGDEVAAFAKLLDVDPSTLPDPDDEP